MSISLFTVSLPVLLLMTATAVYLLLKKRKLQRSHAEAVSELQKSQMKNTELETELRLLKEKSEAEKKWVHELEGKLKESFENLATKALEGNHSRFLELAGLDFEKKQMSMESLVKPMQETLRRYEEQTSMLEKNRQKAFVELESEMKKMAESSMHLSKETAALKNALKKPHVRGRWGEVQLRNCIELAGMSDYADVDFQDGQTFEGKRLIPDMTVRMPGERVVIVDAKTPLEAFMASLEATTEEQRSAEMIRHGKHIRTHVNQLSEKGYAQQFKNSADFTVLFLPNESFLYAALETQPDLVDYALSKKILIATPPTLVGLLKVVRFGWSEKKLAKNAAEIANIGKELHKRIVDFTEAYEEVGTRLDQAQKAYDTGRMRIQSRIAGKARQLEELGAKSNKELPELTGL